MGSPAHIDSPPVRRNWFIAAILLGIVAIVIAAVALRLTDDSPETTAEWADSVCTSLSDWRGSITALADVGGESLTADSLRDRLDEAESATTELVTDLRELGAPDVVDGEEVEQALDDAAAGLEESYDELQSAAEEAVDAENQTEFLAALSGLADDFQALLDQVRDVVATLQSASLFGDASAELEQAFADAPSCQALQSES
jgi:flagellar motor protein MotB